MEFLKPLQVIWDYLCLNEPLPQADCIVGFGNFNTDIARRAAELYHQGYAPKILFTGGLGRNTKFDSWRIEICVGEVWLLIRVNRRRKFAGSMWKKPEVLDRKSGADKW